MIDQISSCGLTVQLNNPELVERLKKIVKRRERRAKYNIKRTINMMTSLFNKPNPPKPSPMPQKPSVGCPPKGK